MQTDKFDSQKSEFGVGKCDQQPDSLGENNVWQLSVKAVHWILLKQFVRILNFRESSSFEFYNIYEFYVKNKVTKQHFLEFTSKVKYYIVRAVV